MLSKITRFCDALSSVLTNSVVIHNLSNLDLPISKDGKSFSYTNIPVYCGVWDFKFGVSRLDEYWDTFERNVEAIKNNIDTEKASVIVVRYVTTTYRNARGLNIRHEHLLVSVIYLGNSVLA